jgi:hypothetical protein
MIGGLITILFTALMSLLLINSLKRQHPFIKTSLLNGLYFYHLLLSFAYYGYILLNGSDSLAYYQKVIIGYRGETWWSFYGTSTTFIEFLAYPFIIFLGFSYEATMALFSFFGFIGFIYFYIFFRENVRYEHKFLGLNLLTLIFFLPNLHFWSASLGKGSVVFLGFGLFFYGISNFQKRLIPLIIGGVIIYHVRPHIMLIVLVSSIIGFVFSKRGISVVWRFVFLAGASVAFFFIYKDVLSLIGIDEEEFMSQGLDLTHRASELSKATSGIDIASYNLAEQLFAFLYRPLFFDAPGVLGIIVSFENVFYLVMTLMFLSSWKGFKYLFTTDALIKSAFLSFFMVSLALAQIAGNLGLAMRQKSQVMILFLFVIISYLDERMHSKTLALKLRREKMERLRKNLEELNTKDS